MALVPYRDVNSSPQRSRSSSLSTPSSASYLYQEVVNIGENTLIRSYSCDQILKKRKDGQTFQSTYIHVSSYVSPNKKVSKAQIEDKPQVLSTSRNKTKATKSKLKRGMRRVIDFACVYANVPYIFIHIILLSLCINLILKTDECNKSWNITDTVHKLQNTVFGQQAAVKKVEMILNEFNHSKSSLIIAFTGTVGVGKTLVSSIIYNDFPWTSNEYISFFNDGLEQNISGKKYSFCNANLLIIDGLHTSTAKIAVNILIKLISSLQSNQKMLVIIIFQIQNENDELSILKDLENLEYEDFKYYHVPFKNLTEKTVMECFKVELKRQNKTIPFVNLNELVKEQMKICPISKSLPGCKNVFHEVSFLPNNA